MEVTSYMFWLMDDLRGRLYTVNVEDIYPADLLSIHNKLFCGTYRLSCFLMECKDKMAFYHHYFTNTGSAACTGMAEIVTEPI